MVKKLCTLENSDIAIWEVLKENDDEPATLWRTMAIDEDEALENVYFYADDIVTYQVQI